MGSVPSWYESFCRAPAVLRGTEPVSELKLAMTNALFYIAALSMIFFFSDFVSGYLALTRFYS